MSYGITEREKLVREAVFEMELDVEETAKELVDLRELNRITLQEIKYVIVDRIKNTKMADYPNCCTETLEIELENLIDTFHERFK